MLVYVPFLSLAIQSTNHTGGSLVKSVKLSSKENEMHHVISYYYRKWCFCDLGFHFVQRNEY